MAGLINFDEALRGIERLQIEPQQTQVGPSKSFPQADARSLGSRGQNPQTPHPQVRNPPAEPFLNDPSSLRSAHESRAPHPLSLQTRRTRWPSLTKFSAAMGQVEEPEIPRDQHFPNQLLAPRDTGYAQPRTPQTQRAQNGPSQSSSQPTNAIVIKNIHAEVTRETLSQIMSDLAVPLPHALNYHFDRVYPYKFRGLAFANFSNETEATRVLEAMDGLQVFGKLLRVEYKKELPLEERDVRYYKKQVERREQERTQVDQGLISDLTNRLIREASTDTINQMRRGLCAGMHQEMLAILKKAGVDPVYLSFRNQAEDIFRQGIQFRVAKEAMNGSHLEGTGSRAKPQRTQAPTEHVASPPLSPFSLKNAYRRRTATDLDLTARPSGQHSFTDKNRGFSGLE